MKFRLTSLLLLITFIAVLLWNILQYRYIADIEWHEILNIPKPSGDEVVFGSVSDNHAIILVGKRVQARVKLIKEAKNSSSETLQEATLPWGEHTMFLPSYREAQHKDQMGFFLDGNSYVSLMQDQSRHRGGSGWSLAKNETLQPMQTIVIRQTQLFRVGYSITIEAIPAARQ